MVLYFSATGNTEFITLSPYGSILADKEPYHISKHKAFVRSLASEQSEEGERN